MKKYLCSCLAMLLVLNIPVALALDGNVSGDTEVVLTGTYSTETWLVTVPAKLSPGETGEVKLTGAWAPNKTVTVSCPNKVILTYQDSSIELGVTFTPISATGSFATDINKTSNVSIESKSVAFGTWTGLLSYNVDVQEEETTSFEIGGNSHVAKENMTWGDFVSSNYNNTGLTLNGNSIGVGNNLLLDKNGAVSADSIITNGPYAVESDVETFTIEDAIKQTTITCYAPKNMTWNEWIDSEWNILKSAPYGYDFITGHYEIRILFGPYNWYLEYVNPNDGPMPTLGGYDPVLSVNYKIRRE